MLGTAYPSRMVTPTFSLEQKITENGFDVPYTSCFTEGGNNKTKFLKRVCFGVRNFETFRNRILYCASSY